MLDINKQKMFYSLIGGKVPVYELGKDGKVKTVIVDGKEVPKTTGEYRTGYGKPVCFYADISNALDEALAKSFGIDDSTNYVQICAEKNELPLTVGSVIWKRSVVDYEDADKTIVDALSADYTVKGVADEGLTVDLFLLQRNVK